MVLDEHLSSLMLYFFIVIAAVAGILIVSYVLGPKRRDKATIEPYESGIVSVGDARIRFSAPFFLVAIFFVIFDLEVVFLFAWAIAFKESGWAGFIEASIFIVILLAGLIYLWKLGALDWRLETERQKRANTKTIGVSNIKRDRRGRVIPQSNQTISD